MLKVLKLEKGQIVNIFEDPMTQTCLEGKAKLVRLIEVEDEDMEYWDVEFADEPGRTYARRIRVT